MRRAWFFIDRLDLSLVFGCRLLFWPRAFSSLRIFNLCLPHGSRMFFFARLPLHFNFQIKVSVTFYKIDFPFNTSELV